MPSPAPLPHTVLHHLVALYLAVGYEADRPFEPIEYRAVLRLLLRWVPEMEAETARVIVDTALKAVRGGMIEDVEVHAREVGDVLTPEQRRHVLADLGQIARADGYLSVEEASVIRRVRAEWSRQGEGEQA